MRLDHLLSREYTTTDLVRVAWREGSFESLLLRVLSASEKLGAANFARAKFSATLYSFQGTGKHLERVRSGLNHGGIAQLGEHLLCKQGVCGSIPHISTNNLKKG